MRESIRGDRGRLEDMLAAAGDACEFSSSVDFGEFSRSKVCRYAILHSLTIIGEAASRVSAEFQGANPEIPWRRIVAFRHRLVHGYGDLDLELVWEVATKMAPALREQVAALLLELQGEEERGD